MDTATLVGALATLASTASFVPQAWKVIRTRDLQGISTGMYTVTVLGFSLWLAYGLLLGQLPLIVTNGICLALAAFILAMKLLPPRQRDEVADTLDPTTGPAGRPPKVGIRQQGGERTPRAPPSLGVSKI